MKEREFIRQNKENWVEMEKLLNEERRDPEKLSNLYIKVTDDLSYSRTFYRNRSVSSYLNSLSQQIFRKVYKSEAKRWKNMVQFWKQELPVYLYDCRKDLLLALVIFVIAFITGVVSAHYDKEFVASILGPGYVEMTEQNINEGDPMAVYKHANGQDMFLGITTNNLKVVFLTFVLGIFFIAGTFFMLFYNGVMVGCFQYFFIQKGLGWTSFLSIWLHGTLEISGLIIGAAAGIILGKSIVFPGTYSRSQSLLIGARKAFKILAAAIPIIVIAAIVESFMTRYTEMPDAVKLGIILLSAWFIISYYIYYPYKVGKNSSILKENIIRLNPTTIEAVNAKQVKTVAEIFKDIFQVYKRYFSYILKNAVLSAGIATVLIVLLNTINTALKVKFKDFFFVQQLFNYPDSPLFIIINSLMLTYLFWMTAKKMRMIMTGIPEKKKNTQATIRFILLAVLISLLNLVFLIPNGFSIFLFIIVAPFILWPAFGLVFEKFNFNNLFVPVSFLTAAPMQAYGILLRLLLLAAIYFLMLSSPLTFIYLDFLNWNLSISQETIHHLFLYLYIFTTYVGIGLVFPMLVSGLGFQYFSTREIQSASELRRSIRSLAIVKSTTRK